MDKPLDLIRAYLAGSGLPETAEGVLMRSGVHRAAAALWAGSLSLAPASAGLDEEDGEEGEPDVGMGTGNEVLVNGPILADGFDRFIYQWLGWAYCTADKVKARLAEIEGDVVLRINSPGGHTTEMSAIAVQIAERRKAGDAVDAVIDGMAASAAGVLFLLCDGRRMSEFGTLMLHRAWMVLLVVGNQNDIRGATEGPLSQLEAFDGQQSALIQRVTGKSAAWVANTLDKELWYGRDSGVDSGLATGGYPEEESGEARALLHSYNSVVGSAHESAIRPEGGDGEDGEDAGTATAGGDVSAAEGGGPDPADGASAGGAAYSLRRAMAILDL